MCKAMEDMQEKAMKEGRKEGREENMVDTAKRMLKDGKLPLELIAEYSGLPLEEVVKLKKD